MPELYEFLVEVRGPGELPSSPLPGVAFIDGRGNVFETRTIPPRSQPGNWLRKMEQLAPILGELARVAQRKPSACSVCGCESWNDDDFRGTREPYRIYCKDHIPSDGRRIYTLLAIRQAAATGSATELEQRMSETKWETYEQVSRQILSEFRGHFGLERIDPKQVVTGQRSGSEWEIDAKGIKIGGEGFVIVECRRRGSKQNQESAGALAYRIMDAGADGLIIVSPMGLQAGAAKVANAEGTIQVTLSADATPEEFSIQFFDKGFARTKDGLNVGLEESASVEKWDG